MESLAIENTNDMNTSKYFVTVLVFITFILSTQAQKPDREYKTIVYKNIDTVALTMDLYFPPELDINKSYPAMVFFFGGGWKGGTVKQFEPHAIYFSKRGIICVLADYRVESRHHTTPFESLEDAKSAIRYLRKNALQFHIDPYKIIATGGSAGGHLAAATAVVKGFDAPGEDLTIGADPNALVLFNPVVDNGPGGYGYDRVGERYKEFSPLHNIHRGAPPTIFFLGTQDKLIPVETAKYYKTVMEKVSSRCDLFLYEDQEHGFFNYRNRNYYNRTILEMEIFFTSLGIIDGESAIEVQE